MAALAGVAATALAGPAQDPEGPREIQRAWYRGELVKFNLESPREGREGFRLGPFHFGRRVANPKPSDRRLNLYLVAPGTQHGEGGENRLAHDHIISDLPPDGRVREWDVYWAVVLDSNMQQELHSEDDLLLAARHPFVPSDLFDLEDVPGEAVLCQFLKVDSIRGLLAYRRRDGTLPSVLIVPAGFAVRASAEPVEPKSESAAQAGDQDRP